MLYITGDTHGDMNGFRNRMKDRAPGKGDILLITGDFGFDWNRDTMRQWLDMEKDYTVVFCDGNHENFDILKTLPETTMFGNTVGVFGNDTYRLLTGNMYEIEGLKCFVFGGAFSPDVSLRTPHVSWWPDEIPTYRQYQKALDTLKENNWKFDLFISHTTTYEKKDIFALPFNACDPTETMLHNIEQEIKAHGGSWGSSWFGHFHENRNSDGKYHCRYDGLSLILDRENFKTIPRKRNTKTPDPRQRTAMEP